MACGGKLDGIDIDEPESFNRSWRDAMNKKIYRARNCEDKKESEKSIGDSEDNEDSNGSDSDVDTDNEKTGDEKVRLFLGPLHLFSRHVVQCLAEGFLELGDLDSAEIWYGDRLVREVLVAEEMERVREEGDMGVNLEGVLHSEYLRATLFPGGGISTPTPIQKRFHLRSLLAQRFSVATALCDLAGIWAARGEAAGVPRDQVDPPLQNAALLLQVRSADQFGWLILHNYV